MKTLKIPKNIKYLSEILNDLPYNVIFDKGLVGCGGTTIAIKNNEPYIMSVPYLSLIENKCHQYPNVLAVTATTHESRITKYLRNTDVPKIMCTYDSLCKLTEVIEKYNNLNNFRLLVDEYHLLFTNYSFRYNAVQCVLDNYTKYKSFCFMTATILEEEFILDELKHIPLLQAEWENTNVVTVKSYKCDTNVRHTVSNIIIKYLNGEKQGNAYFFVNSTNFIKEIVNHCSLTTHNTRGIWSKHNKFPMPLPLSKTTDPPKKINFLTSTCFEGVDLYDENAVIYIVSDNTNNNTLIDISTSFQQIACRIRNTKYWSEIHHIYTTTKYDLAISYDEFKLESEKTINKAAIFLNHIKNSPEGFEQFIEKVSSEMYLNKRGIYVIFDSNLVKIDLYNFKITKSLYKLRVNLEEAYTNNNFKVESHTSDIKTTFKITSVFKQVVEECKNNDPDYLKWAFAKYDFLELAIKHLGYAKMEKLRYIQKTIEKYCMKHTTLSKTEQIKKIIDNTFEIGIYYPNTKIKETIQNIYNSLGICKTAKASDLSIYKTLIAKRKKTNNNVINGFIILK